MADIRRFRKIDNSKKTYVNVTDNFDKFVPLCKKAINGLYESTFLVPDKMVSDFKRVAKSYNLRVDTVAFGERNATYHEWDKVELIVSFDKSERMNFAEFCMMY